MNTFPVKLLEICKLKYSKIGRTCPHQLPTIELKAAIENSKTIL